MNKSLHCAKEDDIKIVKLYEKICNEMKILVY